MMQVQPRDLAGHYKECRRRLMQPRIPQRVIIEDPQVIRIAELEEENRRFRDYLLKCRVDPQRILDGNPKKLEVTLDHIICVVCEHYGVHSMELRSARRHKYLLTPRHVVCYLARMLTLLSMPQIGRALGNRDHTTILHGDRRITRLIKADPDLAVEVESLRQRILEGQ